MPGSNISRISTVDSKRERASRLAQEAAYKELGLRVQNGRIDKNDRETIGREFKDIFHLEYYRYMAMFMSQDQPAAKVYYLEHPEATKFPQKHAVAGFNKTNFFVHVRKNDATVGRINYPLDEDISLETKEAMLFTWPGPLDGVDPSLRKRTTEYTDTLYQHDSQRKVRYCNTTNDQQRKTIIRLLNELLLRDGVIDAPGITRLLLKPESIEIRKEESNARPLETLKKYLLLGKRKDAIKYAKTRRIWDHAYSLSLLDRYQPPTTCNCFKGRRLKEDDIVQLHEEYINLMYDDQILQIVYRSLLNRVLSTDPGSMDLVQHPNVGNDEYKFAMLSANDCEMEFDQSNELFKLIQAVKRVSHQTTSHLISLGLITVDNSSDPSEELSYLSNLSFRQYDTHASRTLIISNIDMLIINEIWEYCLNLALSTSDLSNYYYIMDLIPYKLVFASKLLDYGLYDMFASYMASIRNALARPCSVGDTFYDWGAIRMSLDYLEGIWRVLCPRSEAITNELSYPGVSQIAEAEPPLIAPPNQFVQQPQSLNQIEYRNQQQPPQQSQSQPQPQLQYHPKPKLQAQLYDYSQPQPQPQPLFQAQHQPQAPAHPDLNQQYHQPQPHHLHHQISAHRQQVYDSVDSFDHSRYAPIENSMSRQQMHPYMYPATIPEETTDFNPEPETPPAEDNQTDSPTDEPAPPPPMIRGSTPEPQIEPGIPSRTDSFEAFSPINQEPSTQAVQQPQQSQQQQQQASESGFLTSFGLGKLLPKNKVKQINLPDDANKTIIYDEKRGWVDTARDENAEPDITDEPPPMMPTSRPPPPNYSMPLKSTKNRYPKMGP